MVQQDNISACGSQCNASTETWLRKVSRKFEFPETMWRVSEKVCIYRVPEAIKVSKPEDYVPTVVSLGPYHHKLNPQLSKMDQHKLEAVRRVSTRLGQKVPKLIEEMKKLESEIRECYDEPIDLVEESLPWMLTMDACFILEFCRNSAVERSESNPNPFSLIFQTDLLKNSMFYAILDDIIKLENQIPLFVILKLLELEGAATRFEGGTLEYAATELATMLSKRSLFRGFPFYKFPHEEAISKLKEHIMNKEWPAYHLLDLFRMAVTDTLTNSTGKLITAIEHNSNGGTNNISNENGQRGRAMNGVLPCWIQRSMNCIDILPRVSPPHSKDGKDDISQPHSKDGKDDISQPLSKYERKDEKDDRRATPSAQLLFGAGVKFEKGKIEFEKRFGSRRLYLPPITITDNTETRLRNLMAYEECQRCSWKPQATVVSHFVILFDYLIDSEKDVSLLRKSGVIRRMVGCDENIARMFNRIRVGITFSGIPQIEEVMKEVRNHYKNQWKVWLGQLKEEHFSKPWYILSVVGAILILGMTAVQTVYSPGK